MKRLLFLILIVPSLSFAAPNLITGKFDNGDKVTINKNFREQEQKINNRVESSPFTLNGTRGTGSTTPAIGTNAPTLIGTSPYTWVDVYIGTVPCVMPVWRKQ